MVVNLVGICFVRHPFTGFSDNIVEDAKAVATGHLQYGNPATEFVGFSYTPVFTWLFAGLLKIYWWEGWGPVLSMVAALVAMGSIIRMLWATTMRWESRLVTASFVVALSMGGLSALPILGLPISGLYEARPDQLAWCLLVVSATIVFTSPSVVHCTIRKADVRHWPAPDPLGLHQANDTGAQPRHRRYHSGRATGARAPSNRDLETLAQAGHGPDDVPRYLGAVRDHPPGDQPRLGLRHSRQRPVALCGAGPQSANRSPRASGF